jgi:hypothetical protein
VQDPFSHPVARALAITAQSCLSRNQQETRRKAPRTELVLVLVLVLTLELMTGILHTDSTLLQARHTRIPP